MRFSLTAVSALAVALAALAGCGAQKEAGAQQDLASWRERVCAHGASYEKAMESAVIPPPDAAAPFSAGIYRRHLAALRKFVAELRALPLPTERRADAERFVQMFVVLAERYEQRLPRIEAAMRRFQRVMKTIKPADLPPFPKGETAAGGIMSQVLSIPAARDAWNDMIRETAALAEGVDEKETELLTKRLGLDRCDNGSGTAGEGSRVEPRACRPGRGSPVDEQELRRALASEGIKLYRDDRCYGASLSTLSNITTSLPYEEERAVRASEGSIFCDISARNIFGPQMERFVWRNDPTPTELRVLNVSCSIYPETRAQTDRLERALRRLSGVSRAPTSLPSSDAIRD